MNKQHERLDEESVATLELGLTKQENASKNFTISEHDIAEASEDVDLISIASIGNKSAGDENPSMVDATPGTTSPNGSEIGLAQPPTVQEIPDDEVSNATSTGSGGYIDEEVANAVLSTSQNRVDEAKNALYKKYCLYGTIGLCVFIAFLAISDPDSSRRSEVEKHGSAYHYADQRDYPDSLPEIDPDHTIFDTPIPFTVKYPAKSYGNVVDIRGPAYRKGQTPFYWSEPGSCYLVEHVMAQCHGLVLAFDDPGPPELSGELKVFSPPGTTDVRLVNVDLTEVDTIRDAAHMGLVVSQIADFISSPKLHAALTSLFNPSKHSARALTILRHPVDRAISHYFEYTTKNSEHMTLEEFVHSDHYKNNYATNTLSLPVRFPSTQGHLALAKELLRTKFIVGLHDRIAESLELFEDYLFLDGGSSPKTMACKNEKIQQEVDRDMAVFDTIGHRIKKGDPEYNMIAELNVLDMELYWYTVALYEDQRAWIPRRDPKATS